MSDFQFAKPAAPVRAVLLAQVGLFILVTLCIWPVWSIEHSRTDEKQELREIVAQRDRLLNSETALDRSGELFFDQSTPQLAQAELTDTVQALSNAYDIEIEVLQSEDVSRVNGLVQLTLVVSGAVPEARLGDFLSALANARPVILVNDMNLRRARALTRREAIRKVAFQLDLRAFLKG